MNTAKTNNETSTPAAKAKVSKKAEAKAAAVTGLAAALFVVVTLPPVAKFEQGLGYYTVELRNFERQLVGKSYHTKSTATAKALAEKIAHDRNAEIVTVEIPSIQQELEAIHKQASD